MRLLRFDRKNQKTAKTRGAEDMDTQGMTITSPYRHDGIMNSTSFSEAIFPHAGVIIIASG